MSDESSGPDDRTNESPDEPLVERRTTGEDRVRMVARQLSEPRTANWIANEAGWSHEPTTRVLDRLVDDGVLRRDDGGAHTTYAPDYRLQATREATALRDSAASVEALTDRLSEMRSSIQDWMAEFDVETPNELRATVANESLTAEEAARRRDVAREWEHLERRIEIVRFAVREWDFLDPGDAREPASN